MENDLPRDQCDENNESDLSKSQSMSITEIISTQQQQVTNVENQGEECATVQPILPLNESRDKFPSTNKTGCSAFAEVLLTLGESALIDEVSNIVEKVCKSFDWPSKQLLRKLRLVFLQ